MKIITEKLQNLWSSDEVRILVLTSLGMQIALIFLAPLRKRITNIMLALTLWLLYLTADNVATLGLGNISHQTPAGSGVSSELTVLWAPFLLVHLGGPDTITSYAIEDNELWWRHLLGLLFQVIITVYIFIQSPPTGWLWIPTIFVFIPGLIKFAERTHALRLASKDNIKDKILSELRPGNRTMKGSEDNTTRNPIPAPKGFWGLMGSIQSVLFPPEDTIDILVSSFKDISNDEGAAILEGFRWFDIFKRLLVDVTFPADLLMKSQDRFSDLSNTEALDLVAIELSFLYDYLHTKAVHMHCFLGRALRYFSLVSIIAALVVFHHLDMQKYVSGDIIITYILFGVGLSLEVIATILLIFSDWTVVALKRTQHSDCVVGCITTLVNAILKKGKRRWGHTIGHFNVVGVCLRDRDTIGNFYLVHVLAKIMRILKLKNKWDNMRESKLIPFPNKLVEIMVTEAKRRAQNVHIYKVLVEARAYRGNKTLERHNQLEKLEWSMKREFDESIILWHLATDICYYLDETSDQPNGQPSGQSCLKSCLPGTSKQPNEKEDTERYVSWKTSNYMIYLLTQQQSMMQLGYGETRFEATCVVVKNKLKGKEKLDPRKACDMLMKDAPVSKGSQPTNKMGTLVLKKIWAYLRCWGRRKHKDEEATQVSEENNSSVTAEGSCQPTNKMGTLVLKKIWANLRCWGRRKHKDEEATQVSEENNSSVTAEGSQPTNKMGTSVLKKIWANLRSWGRCKRKRKEENNAQVSTDSSQPTNEMGTSEDNNAQVSEENNAPVSTDSSQPTNEMGTSEDNNAQVSEENNAPVSTDSSQPTNKMGTSEENNAQVSKENNAPVSTDSIQPTNKMGTSVLKKIWENLRQLGTSVIKKIWANLQKWGKRKREEDQRKRDDETEMGEQVLRDSRRLAKELQELKPEIKWKLISETWMEMLGYAAIHCDSYQHAKSLSRGGELLTHLWLLMSQLGVVEEHKMQQYQSGTV